MADGWKGEMTEQNEPSQDEPGEDFVQLVNEAWARRAEQRDRGPWRPLVTHEVTEEDAEGCE
jgi:hypothetical protein